MAIPGLRPHRHTGRSGLSGSGRLDGQMSSPPMEIGNRQDQQMSVIGLTKLPVHRPGPASTIAGVAVARPRMAASMSASFLKSDIRSEEPTSELESLMRISYDVFCLKHKYNSKHSPHNHQ